MITSARYEYMEGNFAWPVPFPFGSEADVGVRLEGRDGIARTLVRNRDYVIQGGSIVCVVPRGCALVVFLAGSLVQAAAAQAERIIQAAGPCYAGAELAAPNALAPAAAAEPAQAIPAAQPAAYAEPAADARYEELAAQVKALSEQQAKARQAVLDEASQEQLDKLRAAGADAGKSVEQKTGVALDAISLATEDAEARLEQNTARALAATAMADTAADKAAAAGANVNAAASEALARLEARVRELEARLDDQAGKVEQQASNAAGRAAARIVEAQTQAQAELKAQARLAGQAWPQLGWQNIMEDLPARSVIRLPGSMLYYPGRNSLAVARNGFMLTLGHDFEEVGAGTEPSSQVKIISPVNEGDLISFWVYPTNVAQAAREAQAAALAAFDAKAASAAGSMQLAAVNEAAGKSVTANARHLSQIDSASAAAQTSIRSRKDAALTAIRNTAQASRADCVSVWQTSSAELRKLAEQGQATLRDIWRKAETGVGNVRKDCFSEAQACEQASSQAAARAGNSAAKARELADCAWRAAFQASIDRAQPGIGAVPSYADLMHRPSGFYVINPLIKNALPFMGVFPVKSLADAAGHDGVFIVGAQPYPEDVKLPDIPYPDDPAEVPEMQPPASVNHWLPCKHSHE